MEKVMNIADITIIGGGPVGLFTAFYGGLRRAKVKIIESLPHLGGQLTALYPEKYIYDVPGFPKIRAQELIDNLTKQFQVFEPTICLSESVSQLEKQDDGIIKITTNRAIHFSKTVIITAGSGAFRPRKLEINGAEQFEQFNLHYFVNDISQYEDKQVAILGGGDSAVDWALMLEPIAKKVILVHRREKFRAHEHSIEKLTQSSVEIRTPYVPIGLNGKDSINQLIIEETKSKQKETIDIDYLIINYGFTSALGPIKEWGLTLEKNSILVNSKQETNIPGIYAAGDICTYDGKVKLIVTGFAEGPTAINHAKVYIDPKSKVQPLHSTSLFH